MTVLRIFNCYTFRLQKGKNYAELMNGRIKIKNSSINRFVYKIRESLMHLLNLNKNWHTTPRARMRPRSYQLKACSHDPFLRIRFLLVPKNGSCEHIKNDLPLNGSVILKKRMEIEHVLFSSDTLLER